METVRRSKVGCQALAAALTLSAWHQLAQAGDGSEANLAKHAWERPGHSPNGVPQAFPGTEDYRGGEGLFADYPAALLRDPERGTGNRGERGILARYRSPGASTEFGFYWSEFQDKYIQSRPEADAGQPPDRIGAEYALAYPEGVRLLGAGFRTSIHKASLGSDVQIRRNASLAPGVPDLTGGAPAESQNKLDYIVSRMVNFRLSAAYALPATTLWDGASLRLEVGRQRLANVSRNAQPVDPGANRNSQAVQMVFTPSWKGILPNLDLSLPLVLAYSPKAQSPLPNTDATYKGARMSIGASAVYQKTWNADVRYLRFFGDADGPQQKSRDFVWVSIQRSF